MVFSHAAIRIGVLITFCFYHGFIYARIFVFHIWRVTVIFVSGVSLLYEKYQATPNLFVHVHSYSILFLKSVREECARVCIGAYLIYFHDDIECRYS